MYSKLRGVVPLLLLESNMKYQNIIKYADQKNSFAALFGSKESFVLSDFDSRKKLSEMVEYDLSPENLTCDGELFGPIYNKVTDLWAWQRVNLSKEGE